MSVERARRVIEEEIAKLQGALALLSEEEEPVVKRRAAKKATPKKKSTMSPKARKAIALAMRKRWAAKKAAAKAS